MTPPVNNLAVSISVQLGAERRPSDEALEHDCADTPPVAAVVVAATAEDLGRDVVGRSYSRVGKLAARFAPSVDLIAVADCQLDLIDGYGVAIGVCCWFGGDVGHELLVV